MSLDVIPMNENCVATYNPAGTNVEVINCYLACNETDGCNNQTSGENQAKLKTELFSPSKSFHSIIFSNFWQDTSGKQY